MAAIAGAAIGLTAQRKFKADYQQSIAPVIQSLQQIVMTAATSLEPIGNGKTVRVIPKNAENGVLQQAGDTLQRFFVGPDMRSPFSTDGVTPLAVYPTLLNKYLAMVTVQVIQKHADYLKKKLPAEVHQWLGQRLAQEMKPLRQRRNRQLREQQLAQEAFIQNPLVYYDAPHTWLDRKKKILSDRIWNTSLEMRIRIDQLLSEGIREGRSALDIAADLERFLNPGLQLKRTNKPYGTNASYYAMRLSRSEIAYAHSNATRAASYANPLVDGWEWALSASHPEYDICDKIATIGMRGERLRPPYPLDGHEPIVVKDSHPQCICTNRSAISEDIQGIINQLREDMVLNRPAPVAPVDVLAFVRVLIGAYLAGVGWEEAQRAA